MEENREIAILNNYPTDKYNLLVPVKTMQEISSMYKIVINEVEISNDINGGDVYVQTKGYGDNSVDKLALNKTALSKLMSAAGIKIISSKAIIPSTHQTAIEMARAIGKVVEYDTRDTAHEVVISVPEASGQFRTLTATKEIIIDDLKAEYIEQKKNLKVYKNKKPVNATDKEKADAVEKQLTQFLSHKRGQCETKALNRALREAMSIKPTYTKDELKKPFIVAHYVPNLDNPELKNVMINQYANSLNSLFGPSPSTKQIEAPTDSDSVSNDESTGENNEDIPSVDAEIIEDVPNVACGKCGLAIEGIDEQWTADAIITYSKTKFQGEIYCPDCQKEVLAAFRKAKETGKNEK